ncbi:DUF4846 domain-containing protein [Chryseobacterium sp. PTM-20240506]|uniref:DUF4846 domain-containing protein n=1 Tax=unclassified Chryseobacterium TaxID=2593645 RepID=UPI0023590877|nr:MULTISPECIES: DUF4846 domain-containing protein [unclassified Chryseobacterium]MDC8105349.1 DUF4846 domain-containing protein [Chryseobacterium sp. B21-037]MDQ1805603.1 DUF4846 domain-containing protein [Chryseobacterium sp. CKR4-1]WBV58759.1 DUF4846 domain-containing protein [Chryseobacterium daecheongense]
MAGKTLCTIALISIISCIPDKKRNAISEIDNGTGSEILVHTDKNTIKERFSAPQGYEWIDEKQESFGYFLENFTLKPYKSKILRYDGNPISTQHLHEAIFDIDTGDQDLQQCADAVIRLRAEYLVKNKRQDEIQFHFTNGDLLSWKDYKNGTRAFVNGNSVNFKKTASFDDSPQNFRSYLNLIFNYAGTISLNKETKPVLKSEDLKSGDILITPGSPGHVVLISGACRNKEGKKLFLLSEGFTPAQSIHVLSNPFDKNRSPWYNLDVKANETKTARYIFKPTNFRSF